MKDLIESRKKVLKKQNLEMIEATEFKLNNDQFVDESIFLFSEGKIKLNEYERTILSMELLIIKGNESYVVSLICLKNLIKIDFIKSLLRETRFLEKNEIKERNFRFISYFLS
jgi:hypothetical protein